jgi:hypothetical protein
VNTSPPPVAIALRIPGNWPHPGELIKRLPAPFRFKEESLLLPDGQSIELGLLQPDNQFAGFFRSSCRQPATEQELEIVDTYSVNITLCGPGGSLEAARTMMKAASAIVRAGGAGVFIDNCTLSHGGENWLAMTADGSAEALSFAFVAIVRGKTDVWTMGMHALGFREILMSRVDADKFDIIEMIRYVCAGDKPIHDGDLIVDLDGPRFQAFLIDSPTNEKMRDTPMHNPFGRIRLVSMRDVAEAN